MCVCGWPVYIPLIPHGNPALYPLLPSLFGKVRVCVCICGCVCVFKIFLGLTLEYNWQLSSLQSLALVKLHPLTNTHIRMDSLTLESKVEVRSGNAVLMCTVCT